MKITKLKIDKHKHLENLEFDFTYPEDFHIKEKRGKPLDKICFIGQSGTGKTNLLELIYNDLFSILSIELDGENVWRKNGVLLSNYLQIFIENIKFESLRKDTYDLNILVNDKKLNYSQNNSTFPQSLFSNSNKVFFLKSSIISTKNINILNSNPLELKESIVDSNNTLNNTIEFDEEISPSIWYFILASVIDFHSNRYKKYNELIGKGLISDLTKFNKQVLEFLKENPNPLESLSKKFNPIFKKLGLQIDIDNTEYSIPIKNILKDIHKVKEQLKESNPEFFPLVKGTQLHCYKINSTGKLLYYSLINVYDHLYSYKFSKSSKKIFSSECSPPCRVLPDSVH